MKETADSTTSAIQHKGHEWAESAQSTLEAAREKAREVFTGTTSKTMETPSGTAEIKTSPGTAAHVKVDETPGMEPLHGVIHFNHWSRF